MNCYQVVVAKWLAWRLDTGEDPSSNPDKGDKYFFLNKKELFIKI